LSNILKINTNRLKKGELSDLGWLPNYGREFVGISTYLPRFSLFNFYFMKEGRYVEHRGDNHHAAIAKTAFRTRILICGSVIFFSGTLAAGVFVFRNIMTCIRLGSLGRLMRQTSFAGVQPRSEQ